MTTLSNRLPYNVPGRFYVTSDCIDCGLCHEHVPSCFGRNEDEGMSYVHKQPSNESEVELCLEAVEMCPVSAIVDSGQS
jgi:ferredoxin